MLQTAFAQKLADTIIASQNRDALKEALSFAARAMDFPFFALNHHPRRADAPFGDIWIHNYPAEWEEYYSRQHLGFSDPIHRASHIHGCGFRWREIGAIIPMTKQDLLMFQAAETYQISDGFTVPTNIPGEPHGSVTFAGGPGVAFPEDRLFIAERLGRLAFQRARAIAGGRLLIQRPPVTDRHIEIGMWIGRDKSDWEIGEIMRIKRDTVSKQVRAMCERLGAVRRSSLPLRLVYGGLMCFSDIF